MRPIIAGNIAQPQQRLVVVLVVGVGYVLNLFPGSVLHPAIAGLVAWWREDRGVGRRLRITPSRQLFVGDARRTFGGRVLCLYL